MVLYLTPMCLDCVFVGIRYFLKRLLIIPLLWKPEKTQSPLVNCVRSKDHGQAMTYRSLNPRYFIY
jgi:hypothetical protein